MRISYEIESGVEALKEPDDYGRDEDYGEGLLEEVFRLSHMSWRVLRIDGSL